MKRAVSDFFYKFQDASRSKDTVHHKNILILSICMKVSKCFLIQKLCDTLQRRIYSYICAIIQTYKTNVAWRWTFSEKDPTFCLNFFGKLAATWWKIVKQIQSRTLYAAEVCLGWQFELKFSFMGKGPPDFSAVNLSIHATTL